MAFGADRLAAVTAPPMLAVGPAKGPPTMRVGGLTRFLWTETSPRAPEKFYNDIPAITSVGGDGYVGSGHWNARDPGLLFLKQAAKTKDVIAVAVVSGGTSGEMLLARVTKFRKVGDRYRFVLVPEPVKWREPRKRRPAKGKAPRVKSRHNPLAKRNQAMLRRWGRKPKLTLVEMGELYGLTPARVGQIIAKQRAR